MNLNFFERTLAKVAPAVVANRVMARVQLEAMQGAGDALRTNALLDDRNAGYSRGGSSRDSWAPFPRDAIADSLPGMRLARGQSRDLARSSPIAVGAINTNVDRVVGTGLALSAQPNRFVLGWSEDQALEWKRKVQNEFSLWADSTDSDQCETLTFYQQQALVLRAVLESGDAFTILPDGQPTAMQPYKLRVQVIEADRVGNPSNSYTDTATQSGGVQTNPNGAPIRYHFYTNHPGTAVPTVGSGYFTGTWYDRLGRSGRRKVLHHFRKLRPEQPRGLPYLTPIIDSLKQISRYTEAEIMAAVISSYFTVFIETPTGAPAPVYDGQTGPAPGNLDNEIELSPGMAVGLAPGEKVTAADPSRPNPNFGPFIDAVITQMGMALSLPRELLLKQFNASYSASKAALLDAWIYFRTVRAWMALTFCQPIYETWLAEAVASGRVAAPGFFTDPLMRWAYTRALWPGDSMGSINPKDEVAAYSAAIEARVMTRERAEWELFGTDFNDTFDAKKSEYDRLKAAGMLPVPKAGAAKPVDSSADPEDDPTNPPTDKPKP